MSWMIPNNGLVILRAKDSDIYSACLGVVHRGLALADLRIDTCSGLRTLRYGGNFQLHY